MTVNEDELLADRFEEQRKHLYAVAYRMLGSSSDAEDAVQEAWLRLDRSDRAEITNLGGWLTTVVARVCLDMLRARKSRRDELEATSTPPSGGPEPGNQSPEQETLLADSVGLALLVILETLRPAERLAFVLHDMFDVPYEKIGPIVGTSEVAAKKLASRARQRIRGEPRRLPDEALCCQRAVVEAFLAASRAGDFEALLAVLDPDVVARADAVVVQGARAVGERALLFSRGPARWARVALVNGSVGLVVAPSTRLTTVLAFEITGGKITALTVFADPTRFHELELALLDDWKGEVR